MINLEERVVEKKSFFNRLLIVYLFFALIFIFFLQRTYSLQVSEFNNYELAAIENKTKEVLVQPIRGIIYDRNGNILVNNVPSYDLIIKPWQISNIDNFIKEISLFIDLKQSEIDFVYRELQTKVSI